MLDIRSPLSRQQVEDLLFERGIDICHKTVRFWWNRFGPIFAPAIRKRRIQRDEALWQTPSRGDRPAALLRRSDEGRYGTATRLR
jgi:hypothetical protein